MHILRRIHLDPLADEPALTVGLETDQDLITLQIPGEQINELFTLLLREVNRIASKSSEPSPKIAPNRELKGVRIDPTGVGTVALTEDECALCIQLHQLALMVHMRPSLVTKLLGQLERDLEAMREAAQKRH